MPFPRLLGPTVLLFIPVLALAAPDWVTVALTASEKAPTNQSVICLPPAMLGSAALTPRLDEPLIRASLQSFGRYARKEWGERGISWRLSGEATADWKKLYHRYYLQAAPTVRVLLNGKGEKRFDLGGSGELDINGRRFKSPPVITLSNTFLTLDGKPCEKLEITPEDDTFTLNGRSYRGRLTLLASPAPLAVNTVSIEEYLFGVVAAELPVNTPAALQMQAVLARTLVYYRMAARSRAPEYELTSLTADQAYHGTKAETPQAIDAVCATAGLVVTYRKHLIDAFYASTCGGKTAEAAWVWGNGAGYTRSVGCSQNGVALCGESPHYAEWQRTISRSDLAKATGMPVSSFRAVPSREGRIQNFLINDSLWPYEKIKARLARIKGANFLKSNWLKVKQKNAEEWEITGRGLGHGVGLCQWGALTLARKPFRYNCQQILDFYYPGCQVVPWAQKLTDQARKKG